jgi:hypothetical protein
LLPGGRSARTEVAGSSASGLAMPWLSAGAGTVPLEGAATGSGDGTGSAAARPSVAATVQVVTAVLAAATAQVARSRTRAVLTRSA